MRKLRQNLHAMKCGFSRFLVLSLMALGVLFILVDCSEKKNVSTDSTSYTPGTFAYVYNNIIKARNCVECHSPTGSATSQSNTTLDFTSQATAHSTLTGGRTVVGISSSTFCSSVRLVDSVYPANSYLLGVLVSTYRINNFAGVSGCTPDGDHLTRGSLSTEQVNSLVDWITAGALDN